MEVVSLTYKVLSGQANESEKEELDRWIAQSEANRREFEDIRLLWENSATRENGDETNDSGFEEVRSRLKKRVAKKRRIRAGLWMLLVVVVGLILLLLIGGT